MDLKKHYQELFKLHSDSPKSVQWSDENTQENRFKILLDIDPGMTSIIDVGCGLGHLYDYAKKNDFKGKYCGLDFVPEFIDSCKSKYLNDPNATFIEFDINTDSIPQGYDYILLSGVFNNLMTNNWDFMTTSVNKMFDSCIKGVAFNALTTYVDYESEGLFYSNPLEIFDFCKRNISNKIILRHDYLVKPNSIPFEYSIYLFK